MDAESRKIAIRQSLLEVQDILVTTMKVLAVEQMGREPQISNPSFGRYFYPNQQELGRVMDIYRSVLAIIGAPLSTRQYEKCYEGNVAKLWLFNGDPPQNIRPVTPTTTTCRNSPMLFASTGGYIERNIPPTPDKLYGYIVFCDLWFATYRPMTGPIALDINLNPPGRSIETCGRDWVQEATGSSSQILLHELIHDQAAYFKFRPNKDRIGDVNIQRPPPDNAVEVAYGSFRSMHMKDWPQPNPNLDPNQPPPPKKQPIDNADNYVYTALEIYYKYKYNLPDWIDPPDPKYAPPCPPLRHP
ncbi:hypothetical protein PMZ80_004092 [Knufia obscura]|uniref:Lysine-specific metallo-endopeptidase domain-containing protein n=1 Tax=Knufia obscura TaxID=1635080 RepID=A0ABR0RRT2_9EURO|nr:hypothetical protein PMZ80_004092 [Knufia obscura]